jgi:UDP-glucose 4-epimerase
VKIVITGALGHIGSRLIRAFPPGRFSEVLLLDDLSTQRYASLFRLPEGVPFRFVEEDILTAELERHFAGAAAVIHLAAITTAAASFDIRDQVERVNLEGAQRVARACVKTGSRLVFPSSTSVYTPQGAFVQEDCPESDLRPQNPYADSKLRAERLLRQMGKEEGLRFAICRLGTLFGPSPGMRFHTAVNKFAWQACLGLPLTVWRTALNQKRPYLDLEDAVRAILFILERDLFEGETYNVLSVNATVADILEILRRHFPRLEVEAVDARAMNELSYEVSSAKFREEGFRFEGSLDRGVSETVALLRDARSG